MRDYAALYGAGDYINALAVWDCLAEANYEHICRVHKASYTPALPPIISSFMPKAGGTFLFNRMIQTLGYYDFPWGVTVANSYTQVYPAASAVEVYQRGGFFCHSHAQPFPHFRMIMERRNVGPIWIHIRHPAEACLAGYFHFHGEGQGEGAAGEKRVAAMEVQRDHLRDLHSFELGEWPPFFRRWVGFYADWIAAWLDYETQRPGSTVFTYFDELPNPSRLLARVFLRHGYHLPEDDVVDHLADDRRRKGGNHDWRLGLSEDDIASQAAHLAVWDRAMATRVE